MPRLIEFRRLFHLATTSRSLGREVDDELAFHLAAREDELVRLGADPESARAEAAREFGDVGAARDDLIAIDRRRLRQANRREWLGSIVQDVRFAVRLMRNQPGFTAVAILTLAIGIGATTSIYSVVENVLIQSIPVLAPDRLVVVTMGDWKHRASMSSGGTISNFAANAWSHEPDVFEDAAIYGGDHVLLTSFGGRVYPNAWRVSSGFFTVLGIAPELGRLFAAGEMEPGGPPAVIISHEFWQQHFGGDSDVLTRTLLLDTVATRIVGVMPPGLDCPPYPYGNEQPELWRSLDAYPRIDQRNALPSMAGGEWVVARLRSNVTVTQALARLDVTTRQIWGHDPSWSEDAPIVAPLMDLLVGRVRRPLWIMFGAVGVLLLIACANVGSLLLARATARDREMSVRLALGAGRGRIARQVLTESVLLALIGAVIGVAFAHWGVRFLVRLAGPELPRAAEVAVNVRVLTSATLMSVLAGIVFGLAPAIAAARRASIGTLRGGMSADSSRGRRALAANILAVAQIALTIILLIGGGLLVRSFERLVHVDKGFDSDHVVTASLTLSHAWNSDSTRLTEFATRLLAGARAIPGVEAIGVADATPMQAGDLMTVTQDEAAKGAPSIFAGIRAIAGDYFSALNIHLEQGTLLPTASEGGDPHAAVISASVAQALFAGESPLGRRIRGAGSGVAWTIVGVVHDTRVRELGEDKSFEVYVPLASYQRGFIKVVARGKGDPATLVPAIRGVVADIDRKQIVASATTLESVVSESVRKPRFYATVLAIFAGIALVIATAGLYAVIAYLVARRTREIGVRIALGATRQDVLRMVLGRGATLVAIGGGLGLLAAAWLTRLLTAFLFAVRPLDGATYLGVAMVVGGISMLAAYVPARRAAGIAPTVALRAE